MAKISFRGTKTGIDTPRRSPQTGRVEKGFPVKQGREIPVTVKPPPPISKRK